MARFRGILARAMLAFGVALTLVGAPVVLIEGASECPSPSAVSAELERMVVAPEGALPVERALLRVDDTGFRVLLVSERGEVLGERTLPFEGSCEDRARSAAVVLAAWITNVHPEYVSGLPDPPPLPEPAAPPPPAAPPAPAVPAPAPVASPPPPEPVPERETGARWAVEVAPSFAVVFAGSGASPAFGAELRALHTPSGLGFAGFGQYVVPFAEPLGSGRVRWTRIPIGLGAAYRSEAGTAALDLDASAVYGALVIRGRGFVRNETASGTTLGAALGARGSLAVGSIRPFFGLRAFAYPGVSTAVASAPSASYDLPSFELAFLGGIAFSL